MNAPLPPEFDRARAGRRGAAALLTVAWTLGALGGCGDRSTTGADAGAPMAAASVSASASASASVSAAPTHEPGTVPAPPTARVAPPVKPPLDPPTFTRLPTIASRRSDMAGTAALADARRVVVVGDGVLSVVDVDTGAAYALGTGSGISAWATGKDPAHVAVLERTGRLTVWDTARGAQVRSWSRPLAEPDWTALTLSPDAGRVALIAGELVVLDVGTGEVAFQKTLDSSSVGLAFTGKEVGATGAANVWAWAVDGGVALGDEYFSTGGTFGVAVAPNTRWAAGAAPDGHGLQVADLRAKGSIRQLVAETTCDAHIFPSFSSDSRHVYASGGQRWIKGFETGTWKAYASYHAPAGRSIAARADDLSRVLTTDAEGGAPRAIELSTQREVALPDAPAGASWAMSTDGTRVFATGEAGTRVWNAADGRLVYTIDPAPPSPPPK